jgi:predicted metal-dependent peptidase
MGKKKAISGKSQAAVELALKRAESLSPEEREKIGRDAIAARWEKYYREHPEKLKERQEREARRAVAKKRTRRAPTKTRSR